MSLFSRKEVEPEPVVTGVDALRRAVKVRDAKAGVLLAVVREIDGLGITALEAFAAGKANLSVGHLKALAKVLYPHSEYDPELNLLRSANKASKPMCTAYPERFDPKSAPYYFPHDPDAPRLGPQPVKPAPAKPKPSRPGWA